MSDRNARRSKPGPYGCFSCPRTFAHVAGRAEHETRSHPGRPSGYVLRSRTIAYLWAHTKVAEGCWTFTGPRLGRYGRVPSGHQSSVYAHRLALELELGRELADKEQANHHCDNPPCVRPDHLFVGTQADNVHDGIAKGRLPQLRRVP